MSWFGKGFFAVICVAVSLMAVGCGSSSSSSTTGSGTTTASASVGAAPTAKFVLHAGLAFGAFHRYIYKPFKAGSFSGSIFTHKLKLVKAGLAGIFAYHELKLALADAKASPILAKLVLPISALALKLSTLGSLLKGGHIDTGAIGSAQSSVGGVTQLASQSGLSIVDKVPGLSQLASLG